MNVIYGYRDCESERIHPDDAHLQYGPIATELRKMAHEQCPNDNAWIYMVRELLYWCGEGRQERYANHTYQWLCLFAAELAADEGM
jgi:hypothetical protein